MRYGIRLKPRHSALITPHWLLPSGRVGILLGRIEPKTFPTPEDAQARLGGMEHPEDFEVQPWT